MFGILPPSMLPTEILYPALVGLGAGLVGIVTVHLGMKVWLARAAVPAGNTDKGPDPEFDPFVQGSASEQRKAYRRGGNPVEIRIRKPSSGLEPGRGFVVNRSTGGLCISADEMVPEEVVLEVRPTNAPAVTPWVEVQVRACRRTQDGWELGCQFVRTPPWALLLMFG